MLDTLSDVAWSALPQPPWNNHQTSVPNALRQLAELDDAAGANEIYNQVLFALGNNHRGTIWPVAIAAIPFLVEIVEGGPAAAAHCAAEVLYEVLLFYPDEGFETVLGSDGSVVPLREAILGEVLKFRSRLERIARAPESPPALVGEVSDLIEHIDERSSAPETP